MSDFPEECKGCPFETGDFYLSPTYVKEFKCQCDCLTNCSFYDRAREFVEEE